MNKLYILVTVVLFSVSFTSCTADSDNFEGLIKEKDLEPKKEIYLTQKEGDSLSEGDTGGQGGTNPIKP